jgi:hypothetical protein
VNNHNNKERWAQIKSLFNQAIEKPAAERDEFLKSINDEEIRSEVVSLLAIHENDGASDNKSLEQIVAQARLSRKLRPV